MNKLLKVTLITAIMATSGMCGGGNKPECQGHMPYQTPAYMMPVPQYMAPQKTGLDTCCTTCTKDLFGLTQDTPARSCCMESTLSTLAIAGGLIALHPKLLTMLFSQTIGKIEVPVEIMPTIRGVCVALPTIYAIRSLVPSLKTCFSEPVRPPHPFHAYFVPMAPKCDMGQGVDKGKNCECNDTEES